MAAWCDARIVQRQRGAGANVHGCTSDSSEQSRDSECGRLPGAQARPPYGLVYAADQPSVARSALPTARGRTPNQVKAFQARIAGSCV